MAAIDDLKSAITILGEQIAASNAQIDRLLAKVTSGVPDADLAALTGQINDMAAAAKAETDKAAATP